MKNPNHIHLYSSSETSIEAFCYRPPLTASQKLWLGRYLVEESPKGYIRLTEDLTVDEPNEMIAEDGDYVALYAGGILTVISNSYFKLHFI